MTNEDRKLLEEAARAARAAGLRIERGNWDGAYPLWDKTSPDPCYHLPWAPLERDGDAFRLQVAVGMIVNAPTANAANAGGHAEVRFFDIVITEPCAGHDEESRRAATRRAIVRCAAATVTPQEEAAA